MGFPTPRLLGALMLLLGLAGCVELPDSAPPDAAAAPPAGRSAESLRLEKYYRMVETRLRAQGLLRTDGGGPDTPITEAGLVRNFERIALYDEYALRNGRFVARQTPSILRRWQRPVRIGLVFGDQVPEEVRRRDRADVTAYARRLARLSGLDIRVTDSNPNFLVMFLYRDEQKTIGPELRRRLPGIDPLVIDEIARSPRNTFCVAYAFSDTASAGSYSAAVILVKAEHGALMRLSCIHEEMAQALGLANDSPEARPSIFNDDEEFALLTRHDEMLLQMLYDPRLKPGMTPDQARPLLPQIARDVLRRRGGSS